MLSGFHDFVTAKNHCRVVWFSLRLDRLCVCIAGTQTMFKHDGNVSKWKSSMEIFSDVCVETFGERYPTVGVL
jgi:hypothetical protein